MHYVPEASGDQAGRSLQCQIPEVLIGASAITLMAVTDNCKNRSLNRMCQIMMIFPYEIGVSW